MPYIRLQVKGTANQIASYKGSNGQIVFCDDATAAKWPGKGQRLFVMNGTTSGGRAVLMSHDLPWDTSDIADNAITTPKIKDKNVTTAKLADEAVTTVKIADANVTEPKLATDAVTTNKIKNGNVTNPKLADNAVTTPKIADKNVTGPKLADALLGDGLVRDGSSIKVDFSNLPTDKFEALLKGLKMLIPLTGNKSFYVATDLTRKPNAGDTLIDNRGTQDYPFRTIQACVNYVTNTYSVGKYHISIYVDNGTYNESVTLPDYSRGSGYIEIRPWNVTETDATDWPVTVSATQSSSGITNWVFNCNSGGYWILRYLKIQRIESAVKQTGGVAGGVQASNNSTVSLYGCWVSQEFPSGVTDLYWDNNGTPTLTENFTVRLIAGDGYGRVNIYHGYRPHKLTFTSPSTPKKPHVYVLVAQRSGSIWLTRNYDDRHDVGDPDTSKYVDCAGSCEIFAYGDQCGAYNILGSGYLLEFRIPSGSSVTGTRFKLTGGSYVSDVGTAGVAYFPGTVDTGYIEGSSYSWYAGVNSGVIKAFNTHAADTSIHSTSGSGYDDDTGGENFGDE